MTQSRYSRSKVTGRTKKIHLLKLTTKSTLFQRWIRADLILMFWVSVIIRSQKPIASKVIGESRWPLQFLGVVLTDYHHQQLAIHFLCSLGTFTSTVTPRTLLFCNYLILRFQKIGLVIMLPFNTQKVIKNKGERCRNTFSLNRFVATPPSLDSLDFSFSSSTSLSVVLNSCPTGAPNMASS